MQYKVGDVLWVIRHNDMQVFPIKIIEKIETQRLNVDVTTSYNVALPGTDTPCSLHKLEATTKLFASIEELRQFMITNATSKIDEIIEDAKILEQDLS